MKKLFLGLFLVSSIFIVRASETTPISDQMDNFLVGDPCVDAAIAYADALGGNYQTWSINYNRAYDLCISGG